LKKRCSFVCFGELLLRLSAPEHELLLQFPHLLPTFGGAEANVAVALAAFGHQATLISVVPDNAIGLAGLGELRRRGVNVDDVAVAEGRMGLYFLETGSGNRASRVLYDRAHSAFASMAPERYRWNEMLENKDVLHLSGITPAVSVHAAQAALDAARRARERGITVVFDGNFRPALWRTRDAQPGPILRELFACADIVFADDRDIGLVLGRDFSEESAENLGRVSADAAFAAFPQLACIAATQRLQHSVDHHELSATMHTRSGCVTAPALTIPSIVDRIGTGDAFAAGVLHGLFSDMSDADALAFGLAAGCLKHSIPGDVFPLDAADVAAFCRERRFDVRR
jgi:2-dehydro-3-deoxygluconokinase